MVVHAPNVETAPVRQALAALRQAAVASGELTLPIEIANNPADTVARVTIPIKSADSRSPRAYAALRTLRTNIIPRTIGAVPGVTVGVTGETAANQDFNTLLGVRMPIVFAFVLGLAFLDEQRDVARARLLVLIVAARGREGGRMGRRQHRQRVCHLGIPTGEIPCHHRAPVMTGDMGGRPPEGRDHETHVVGKVIDGVAG